MYWRAYEHLYALTKNCLKTKYFVSKESLVRHGRKNLLSLQQWQGVQISLNIYEMKNVFNLKQAENTERGWITDFSVTFNITLTHIFPGNFI